MNKWILCVMAIFYCIRAVASEGSFGGYTDLLFRDYSPSFLERNRGTVLDDWSLYSRTNFLASRGRLLANVEIDASEFQAANSNASLHKWLVQYSSTSITA